MAVPFNYFLLIGRTNILLQCVCLSESVMVQAESIKGPHTHMIGRRGRSLTN